LELWFMGTSAGRPVTDRNVTSIVLQMPQGRGKFWMFDCGEGTQHRLLKTPFKLSRLECVFITHLHGDHIFGLPGLLSSRSSLGGTEPVSVYGPAGIRELLVTALKLTGTHLGFELNLHEVHDGTVYEDDDFIVETALLDHRIESYGFRITEKPRPGPLNVKLLKEMGIPSGPLYGRLKSGEDVELPDGRSIKAKNIIGPPIPGRIVTILGDTRPTENGVRLSRGADVLVHEATFSEEFAEKASNYGHSTSRQAAETAREAEAKRLFITHFSTRFTADDLSNLEEEARNIFPAAYAAKELVPFPIHRNS
jgi:ribonuclease Z